MRIDLNKQELTIDCVAELIASETDNQSWQIRVTRDGILYLSDRVGGVDLENVLFRMETLDAGNDYVGLNASKDEHWVGYVYETIKKNWPSPVCSFVDGTES